MKVLGLIAEYNPFHNGHLYHLKESKRITGCDYSLCVMSGNFIQRGEPAIVNKWARTKMALEAGIDLILELPVVYSMSSAEHFAHGAVSLLEAAGIVDCLCFGSEVADLGALDGIARVLKEEPKSFQEALKARLKAGESYPVSRQKALETYFHSIGGIYPDVGEVVGRSNNILGIEYLKALHRIGSRIRPYTIGRVGNDYRTEAMTGEISSATAIRLSILNSIKSEADAAIPVSTRRILQEEFDAGRGPLSSSLYETIILSSIRRMTSAQLEQLPDMGEGLHNRVKAGGENAGSLEELMTYVGTRRYTRTRLSRSLFHLLTTMTREDLSEFNRFGGPQYIRVLGFNAKGRKILASMKEKAALPVITKAAQFKNSCNPLLKRMLEIESVATDLYVLGYRNPDHRRGGQEFITNVVRI